INCYLTGTNRNVSEYFDLPLRCLFLFL
ncbi:uncharacterized protein METZ01_LOCUS171988, partial [marine metagenome]